MPDRTFSELAAKRGHQEQAGHFHSRSQLIAINPSLEPDCQVCGQDELMQWPLCWNELFPSNLSAITTSDKRVSPVNSLSHPGTPITSPAPQQLSISAKLVLPTLTQMPRCHRRQSRGDQKHANPSPSGRRAGYHHCICHHLPVPARRKVARTGQKQ